MDTTAPPNPQTQIAVRRLGKLLEAIDLLANDDGC